MATPLVTLSLPTIGRLEFLAPLRRAIEAQTMRDFELLLVDNACPPDARQALVDWARTDARIRHVPVDTRVPMFANFNRGLREARGKYFVTLNDDDVYATDFLERMISMADREPDVGFVGGNFDFIDLEGRVTEQRRWIRETGIQSGKAYIKTVMRNGRNPIAISGTLLRRTALDDRGFDEALSPHYGDFVILMRIAERHPIGLMTDALMQVRRHADQESVRCDHAMGYVLLATQFRAYLAEYRARWPDDRAFASELEGAFKRSNRIMSVWGWMTAPDEKAATDCLGALGDAPLDHALQATLGRAHRIGLDARVRRSVAPLVRRVGNALRGA